MAYIDFFEPERIFTHEQNGTFKRTGFCCRCGDCCKGDDAGGAFGDVNKEHRVEGYCPLFRWMGDKVGFCTNRQHSYYLNGCCDWPTHPNQIKDKPSCTYKFERIE